MGANCRLPSKPGQLGIWSQQTSVGTEAAPRLIRQRYVHVCTGREESDTFPILMCLLLSVRTCVWLDSSRNQISWGTNPRCRFQRPHLCRCRPGQVIHDTLSLSSQVFTGSRRTQRQPSTPIPFGSNPPFPPSSKGGILRLLEKLVEDSTFVSLFILYSSSWKREPVFPAFSSFLVLWNHAWCLVGASCRFR